MTGTVESGSGVWLGSRFRSREEVRARANRLAVALPRHGAAPGATVLLVARNSFLPIEAVIAAAAASVRVVQVSPHAALKEVEFLRDDSGASLVLGDADLLRAMAAPLAGLPAIAQRTPPELVAAHRVHEDDVSVPEWADDLDLVIHDVDEAAGAGDVSDVGDASLTSLFYTSGTTGRAKGVVRPGASKEERERRQSALAVSYGITPGTRGLVTTPMCHMLGSNFAQATLNGGGTVVVMPKFEPADFLRLVERHGITSTPMVPTMFVRLLRLPEEERTAYRLETLAHVLHTGAPCAPDVKRAMIEWWGPIIWEQYGATETGVVALCSSDEWLAHPGTVGRPFNGSVVRIYDADGTVAPTGVVGDIYARMPGMPDFTYLGVPEARAEVEREGLIATGDVGELDDEDYLYLHDRRTDLIVSGGNNVYPAEVEAALAMHADVKDCAVFGVPDDEFGHRVVAAVAVHDGVIAPTSETLAAHLRSHLAGYKVPREYVVVADLPRNEMGKLLRRQVRDGYRTGTMAQ